MKFGKDLEQYKHPGWEDEYINYKMLKDILRKLERTDEEGNILSKDEVDGEFFQALEDELEKVNSAFVEHASQIEAAFDTVNVTRTSSVGKEMDTCSSNTPATADAATSKAEAARRQEQLFYDSYRTLGRLQTFVWINSKGFQKIMKKWVPCAPHAARRLPRQRCECEPCERVNEHVPAHAGTTSATSCAARGSSCCPSLRSGSRRRPSARVSRQSLALVTPHPTARMPPPSPRLSPLTAPSVQLWPSPSQPDEREHSSGPSAAPVSSPVHPSSPTRASRDTRRRQGRDAQRALQISAARSHSLRALRALDGARRRSGAHAAARRQRQPRAGGGDRRAARGATHAGQDRTLRRWRGGQPCACVMWNVECACPR